MKKKNLKNLSVGGSPCPIFWKYFSYNFFGNIMNMKRYFSCIIMDVVLVALCWFGSPIMLLHHTGAPKLLPCLSVSLLVHGYLTKDFFQDGKLFRRGIRDWRGGSTKPWSFFARNRRWEICIPKEWYVACLLIDKIFAWKLIWVVGGSCCNHFSYICLILRLFLYVQSPEGHVLL